MTRVGAIVGPTAVGKTRVSLDVALRLGAEIVSLDSMQLYRGMDIGTDKATAEMRELVPHHLLDVFEVDHEVTVAEFQTLARDAVDSISRRGRLPLLVGGSGLYFRAVVDDLVFPPRSATVREALEDEAEELGAARLYERLQSADPAAAARIEPLNVRRIVRALEVIELTGAPFSSQDAWSRYESVYDLRIAGLTRPRSDLFDRISARVTEMMEAGLAREAKEVAARGASRTARQALGYRQVLEAGPGEDPAPAIVRATKRFARRQESWFRADPRVEWFDASDPDVSARVAAYLGDRTVA